MNLPLKKHSFRRLAAILLMVAAGLTAGCAGGPVALHHPPALAPVTGKVFTSDQLRIVAPGAILGEDRYAEVNSAWLPEWYRLFRAQLFKIGVVRWDERFDCNRFADFYTNLAQAFFSRKMFHSRIPAQALALGPIWYVRADGTGSHAVIQALTERGRVFIDPQTGLEMYLQPIERQSAYVQRF